MIGTMRIFILLLALSAAATATAGEKKVIQPKDFATGRPFSPGILADGTLYVAGQTGTDLKTGKLPDDFESEVKQALENAGAVLKEAGMDFGNVVAVQVYLTDMDLFPRMNAVYTTYFNAGSVDDPEGKTGLAHMFEHMAFKGTETIGTKNWPEEKKALAAIEEIYDRLEQERRKGPRADPNKIAVLQAEVKAAIEKA